MLLKFNSFRTQLFSGFSDILSTTDNSLFFANFYLPCNILKVLYSQITNFSQRLLLHMLTFLHSPMRHFITPFGQKYFFDVDRLIWQSVTTFKNCSISTHARPPVKCFVMTFIMSYVNSASMNENVAPPNRWFYTGEKFCSKNIKKNFLMSKIIFLASGSVFRRDKCFLASRSAFYSE